MKTVKCIRHSLTLEKPFLSKAPLLLAVIFFNLLSLKWTWLFWKPLKYTNQIFLFLYFR